MACKNIAKDYNYLPASSNPAEKIVKIKVEGGETNESKTRRRIED